MIRSIRSLLLFWLIVLTLTASAADIQPIKYVFLFIGDGMALPQQELGERFVQKTENRGLKINMMPYRAITTTHAAGNQTITDSAAAGTAIACGVKTKNGVLGLDVDGNRVESVAEFAKKNGRKVGILTSVTINHATPAAFYAHNASRNGDYEIGLDLIASGFDYFGGGGISKSNDRNNVKYRGDIYALAKEAGYTVCRTAEEIAALKPGAEKVLAFGNDTDLPYAIDGNKEGRRLADFTKQAVELLDNPNGFFMMVEGGKIDWACHDNDAGTTVYEMIEFDDAVKVAFDFAERKPDEVLIIITGDHETGGLKLLDDSKIDFIGSLVSQKASKGSLISQTEKFVKENKENVTFEDYKSFITARCGLVFTEEGQWQAGNLNLTRNEMKELEDDFAVSKTAILENRGDKGKIVNTMIRLLNSKSGVTWSSTGHTALPVCTSTWGNQAEQIAQNIRDNTDIAKQLKQTVGALPKGAE